MKFKLVAFFLDETYYYGSLQNFQREQCMNSKNLQILRLYLNISISRMSNLLKVSDRTVINWESDETKEIDEANCLLLFNVFTKSEKFSDTIKKFVESVFAKVEAEVICYWLRVGPEIILFPDTSRYAFERDKYCNDFIKKRVNQKSLTVEPLKNNKVVNLNEEGLKKSDDKRFANSAAGYCRDGVCHSCLRVPLMVPSDIGLKSIALLSLDNKLENGMPKVLKKEKIFTEEDCITLTQLMEKHYKDESEFYSLIEGFSTGISQKYSF
jgi:transcriptional regulator with XRE-family HTH domain